MRVPNDRKLSNKTSLIDLFLGGHDHIYFHEKGSNGNLFIKSGSDFKSISLINIDFREPTAEEISAIPTEAITDKNVVDRQTYYYHVRNEATVGVTKYDITKDMEIDIEIEEHINSAYKELDKELSQVV